MTLAPFPLPGLRASCIALAACAAIPAFATSTSASAYAAIDGVGVQHHEASGDAGGAQAAAAINTEAVFASAQGAAGLGALHVADVARATVGTDAQAQGSAGLTDAFRLSAAGRDGTQGTMTVSAFVDGGLRATITGFAYADTRVVADLFVDDTGAGNVDYSIEGSARHYVGIDVPDTRTGEPGFTLQMTVPFIFGRDMSLSMALLTVSGITINGSGSSIAEADYSHTMRWGGITDVRDAAGRLVTDFSALGTTSGFDYAATPSVPEPAGSLSMAGGLLALCGLFRRRFGARPDDPSRR